MKLISNRDYRRLLEKEKNIEEQNTVLFEINSILSVANKQFINDESNDIESFKDNLNIIAPLIGEILNYEVSLFGYKYDNKLIDLDTFYKGEVVQNTDLLKMKNVDFDNSIVGRVISNSNKIYILDNKKNKITNYNKFKDEFPELSINKDLHENFKIFFSFLESDIKNIVICPITPSIINFSSPVGYLILANKENINYTEELIKIEVLRNFLYQIFKNQAGLIKQNRDSNFISKIYERHFKFGITDILKYFVHEFGFYYSSFWVPTKEEGANAFGLKECYIESYDKSTKLDCQNHDFYKSDDIILGKISEREIQPNFENDFYIFDNPEDCINTGFRCIEKYFKDKSLLVVPISKYVHQSELQDTKRIDLGYFCFYINKNANFNNEYTTRLVNFIQQISFYIEHILYDHSFHVTKLVKDKIFSLEISDLKTYYNSLVKNINEVMSSEHTSIYFINSDNELFLKASTADEFWEMNNDQKENKEILSEYNIDDFVENPNRPVYKNDRSITFRSYSLKQSLMVHDVHAKNTLSDLSFYEKTKNYHNSIIVRPIIIDQECIGVIKCVNKIELDDSFLKIFSNNDFETLKLIVSFVSSQYTKIKSAENQQLFVEKLAHESKTPVNVILSAFENIEFKLKKENNYNDKTLITNIEHITFATSVINNNYSNLSTFLRNQEKKLVYNFSIVDLKDKIEEITSFLKPLLQKEENKFVSVLHNLSGLPKMYVDEVKMYQVIYNLLSNAIRYCDSSSVVEIEYVMKPDYSHIPDIDNYLEIQFRNFGVGVFEEDRRKIFKEYYRSFAAEIINPNGTGIGLHVAQTIVGGHNGFIEVTKLNKPTIFSIFLPKSIIR